jgi:hypothetical protein
VAAVAVAVVVVVVVGEGWVVEVVATGAVPVAADSQLQLIDQKLT